MIGWILRRRARRVHRESKTLIVARIANEHAPLRALRSQTSKTRLDELGAHSAPLKRRLNRDRPKGKPTPQIGGTHLGECDVWPRGFSPTTATSDKASA